MATARYVSRPSDHKASSVLRPWLVPMLQGKCACSGSAGLNGPCVECQQRKIWGKPLQAKLRINEPGDQYEQEADRVTERVMKMPERPETAELNETVDKLLIRRQVAASPGTTVGYASPTIHEVLAQPGQPLDLATRAFFEPRFGHDFGHVRVHADRQAAESARAVKASAYTVGRDIVFDSRQFDRATGEGRRLLAHELAHVVQQGSTLPQPTLQRSQPAEAEHADERKPVSLSTGLEASHEIVISGETFNLILMPASFTPESQAWHYRDSAQNYLSDYPNLGSGAWAFIVRQRDGALCDIGGNCLGWAIGNYGLVDPPEQVWGLARQFLDSVGRSVRERRSPQETYQREVDKGRSEAGAIWDYYMAVQFQAVPTASDGEANLALYGRGFSGPMDGPSHIAFRTAAGELWVSKPSPSRPPILHESAAQVTGGQTGEVLRLYTRASGPMNQVVLRQRQAQVNP